MKVVVGPDIQMPGHEVMERKPVRINDVVVGFLYERNDELELEVDKAEALLVIIKAIAREADVLIATAAFKNVRFVTEISN